MSGQVSAHVAQNTGVVSYVGGGSEGAEPLKCVSIRDGGLPTHATKLDVRLLAGTSGLNLAILLM